MSSRVITDGAADRDIVSRVIDGDVEAFGILVGRYQDRIYSAVQNYLSNPDDALDVTQDAFVKAYTKLGSFDANSAFYTWLYRIAVNTAIDSLRRKKSKPADSLDDSKYSQSSYEPRSKDPKTDPLKVATAREQADMLRTAIGKLSDKLKSVLVLYDVEGLSQDEVAEILKIPVGTVKSRVSRARAELREILREQMVI
ncbi:MAG: RNA polymerase sigma factor [Armatimonadota bacterium]